MNYTTDVLLSYITSESMCVCVCEHYSNNFPHICRWSLGQATGGLCNFLPRFCNIKYKNTALYVSVSAQVCAL